MKKRKARILVLFLAVLLVSVSACKNPFLKKMLVEEEKGNTVPEKPQAPFVEGGASLILSPNKLTIQVKAVTSDGSAVAVEGCTETSLASGDSTYTLLHATGTVVILKGNITELDCSGTYNDNNKLTALNVQGLTALQRLYCGYNQFTAFDVQGLSALQSLDCIANQLTALNVQDLTALQYLSCDRNQLTALDVQGLTALLKLFCSNNRFTALDVQGLSTLQYLDCDNNQLTALDVQGLSALQWLWCYNNRLTALNVQGCTALKGLWCWDNQLTALNIQGCTALKELDCYNNRLTALNAQGCTALESLNCSGEQLTTLNVQGCTALQTLHCYNNKLTAQAFTKLFDDLPARQDSDKGECILYTEESGVTEGNHKDFSTPPDLAAAFNNAKNNKKWKMYKRNGSWPGVEI